MCFGVEKGDGDPVFFASFFAVCDEAVEVVPADAVGDGGVCGDVCFGEGVNVGKAAGPGLEGGFLVEGDFGDGGGGFEVAEVVVAFEEIIGAGADFVVFEIGLLNGVFAFGDDIDAAAGFGPEDVVEGAGFLGGMVKIEGLQGLIKVLDGGAGHANFGGGEIEGIAQEGHFDVEFGAIGEGAAFEEGEVPLCGFVDEFGGGGVAVEKAFDVSGLDNVESPELDFPDHGGQNPVLISRI